MVSRSLLAIVSCTVACAPLLGGLEEGSSRSDPVSDAGIGDAASCGWLSGFAYRMPLAIHYEGPPVEGYQLKLELDTTPLVASGKMRADGADVRVTLGDGVTMVPHWIEAGLGSSTTRLWVRFDLGAAHEQGWLYYGRSSAEDVGSMAQTFMTGVIDDPMFERKDAWSNFHWNDEVEPSRTNEWSVNVADGRARVRYVREGPSENSTAAGICQTILLPSGSSYRLAFDLTVTIADHGAPAVWHQGPDVDRVLGASPPPGLVVGAEATSALEPGTRTFCLGVWLDGFREGQGAEAIYANPRMRRIVTPAPTFEVAGPEQAGCP